MRRSDVILATGLIVVLLLLSLVSASKAGAKTPEQREKEIGVRMKTLLGPSRAGWRVVRDVRAYLSLERELRRVRYVIYDPWAAINYEFGPWASQAQAVSSCESGHSIWAQNGQYLGLFQMGDYARRTYGHALYALGQARAAFRYFAASGYDWSPWECKP